MLIRYLNQRCTTIKTQWVPFLCAILATKSLISQQEQSMLWLALKGSLKDKGCDIDASVLPICTVIRMQENCK